MKKALNLVIAYFITLLIAVGVGTLLYSFYINVLKYVAGTEIAFFAKNDILYSLFYILFCVLIVICPLISYYRIRHPGGVPQMISYAVLAILTWGLFIPCIYKLSDKYTSTYYVEDKPVPLSKGYFRKVDDKVYYFTDDFYRNSKSKNEAFAVTIDLDAEYRNVVFGKVEEDASHPLFKEATPYRDVLLKNTMTSSTFPISLSFKNIITNSKININGTLLSFIGYLSLGLALSAIFSLTNVFNWKLLNTLLITLSTILVLLFNSLPSLFGLNILEMKMANSGFIKFFSQFGVEPLVVFLNFLFALTFITIGIVVFFVKRHKAKSGE